MHTSLKSTALVAKYWSNMEKCAGCAESDPDANCFDKLNHKGMKVEDFFITQRNHTEYYKETVSKVFFLALRISWICVKHECDQELPYCGQ